MIVPFNASYKDFPDQCPPVEAERVDLNAYRLVANDPPTVNDFLQTRAQYPHKSFEGDQLCLSCGVSVFSDLDGIKKLKKRFPKNHGDKRICLVRISPTDGLVLRSDHSSHLTWWLETSTPHLNFTEIINE